MVLPADNPRVDRREAYLRRAWRLAALLTGDPARADGVLRRCLTRRPDLERLSPDRLDRLVIQETRAASGAGLARVSMLERIRARHRAADNQPAAASVSSDPAGRDDADPGAPARVALAALADLPAQQREAWILRALDAGDEIDASKAMDCSRTALARHLEHAESAMRAALGDSYDAALAALRARAETFDPSPAVAAARDARRLRRTIRIVITIIVITIVVIAAALALPRLPGP